LVYTFSCDHLTGENMKTFTLSDQFVVSIVKAFQKGFIEGSDITDALRGFEVGVAPGDPSQTLLYVMNPPEFEIPSEDDVEEEEQ
jgi:hypothetical protein